MAEYETVDLINKKLDIAKELTLEYLRKPGTPTFDTVLANFRKAYKQVSDAVDEKEEGR